MKKNFSKKVLLLAFTIIGSLANAKVVLCMDSVPNEVQRMFLEHMTPKQRNGVGRVCKIWNFLGNTFPTIKTTEEFKEVDLCDPIFFLNITELKSKDLEELKIVDPCGNSLLHNATTKEVAEFLIEQRGFDVDIKNLKTGETPLLYKVRTSDKYADVCEGLLEQGANPNALDKNRNSQLDRALRWYYDSPRIISLLLSYNGQFFSTSDDTIKKYINKFGNSPAERKAALALEKYVEEKQRKSPGVAQNNVTTPDARNPDNSNNNVIVEQTTIFKDYPVITAVFSFVFVVSMYLILDCINKKTSKKENKSDSDNSLDEPMTNNVQTPVQS